VTGFIARSAELFVSSRNPFYKYGRTFGMRLKAWRIAFASGVLPDILGSWYPSDTASG
jgi:hypothetical protein